jgi:hypothetical protein
VASDISCFCSIRGEKKLGDKKMFDAQHLFVTHLFVIPLSLPTLANRTKTSNLGERNIAEIRPFSPDQKAPLFAANGCEP